MSNTYCHPARGGGSPVAFRQCRGGIQKRPGTLPGSSVSEINHQISPASSDSGPRLNVEVAGETVPRGAVLILLAIRQARLASPVLIASRANVAECSRSVATGRTSLDHLRRDCPGNHFSDHIDGLRTSRMRWAMLASCLLRVSLSRLQYLKLGRGISAVVM